MFDGLINHRVTKPFQPVGAVIDDRAFLNHLKYIYSRRSQVKVNLEQTVYQPDLLAWYSVLKSLH